MGIDSHYGDKELKEKGKWFGIKGEETELLIRHASNSDYTQYLIENLTPKAREFLSIFDEENNQAIQRDSIDVDDVSEDAIEEANQIFLEAAANCLLNDWKKLTLDDEDLADEFDVEPGEPIEYSPENALKLFDLIPDFYEEVTEVANDRAKFVADERKHDKGN